MSLQKVVLDVKKVSKSYTKEIGSSTVIAVSDISFFLEKSLTLGLIGANGAGKSTTIRLLMDFIRPDSGTIRILDRPAGDLGSRRHIGYLPETASFPSNLTILDLIRFTATTCELPKKTRIERSENLLTELNLWEARRKPLRNYSKGMQQRANFVLALLNDPQLLILDEPMSGLDPLGRNQIITLIERLKAEGKTILFCSHILGDVDRLADQLLVLHKGRRLFHGPPQELLAAENAAHVEAAYLSLLYRTEHAA